MLRVNHTETGTCMEQTSYASIEGVYCSHKVYRHAPGCQKGEEIGMLNSNKRLRLIE